MEVVLIVNPFASGVSEARVEAVERELQRVADVRRRVTERPSHGAELAAEVLPEQALVVFSGDGGFNEVLNGVSDGVPVGFLPGGGTSVLSRALGSPRPGRRRPAGRRGTRDRAGAADFARACERTPLRLLRGNRPRRRARPPRRRARAPGRRQATGRFRLPAAAARLAGSRRGRFEPALEVRGLGRAAFALVANTDPYTYAGRVSVHVAPKARFELGLDLVAPERAGPTDLPRLLGYALRGKGLESAGDVLYGHDLDRIEIVCDRPLPLQADGEDLGDVEEAVFEAERDAIAVLI
jgi:diacylglycerol kinase family enzyme